MPNMISFPGGKSESADLQSKWINLFDSAGVDKKQLDLFRPEELLPPLVNGQTHWLHQRKKDYTEQIERFNI